MRDVLHCSAAQYGNIYGFPEGLQYRRLASKQVTTISDHPVRASITTKTYIILAAPAVTGPAALVQCMCCSHHPVWLSHQLQPRQHTLLISIVQVTVLVIIITHMSLKVTAAFAHV